MLLLFVPTGKFLQWLGIALKMGFHQLRDRRMYWMRDTGTSVDYHFADVMSKTTWEQILTGLECPGVPADVTPDGVNISSQPGEAPVTLQPDAVTADQQADRLWKVRGLMQWCIQTWNEQW